MVWMEKNIFAEQAIAPVPVLVLPLCEEPEFLSAKFDEIWFRNTEDQIIYSIVIQKCPKLSSPVLYKY